MLPKNIISTILKHGTIVWHKHALERMMRRGINKKTVVTILLSGEIIKYYTDDKPYPSYLFFGRVDNEPYHIVAAFDAEQKTGFIITAYQPDLKHFQNDYKTRKNEK